MQVKKGDKVKLEYEGKLDSGEVFDSSKKHGQALEFEVGSGQVIAGFDKGVTGMKKGEEKDIKIKPDDGYGPVRKELEKEIPRDVLPKEQEPKPGMMLLMKSPQGQQMPVQITKVTDKTVMINLNHPLAGKILNFKIKLLEITSPKKV